MNHTFPLSCLDAGDIGRVSGLLSEGFIRRRYQDMGIIPGTLIKCVMKGPFGDPHAYLIRGALIAIRNSDAEKILVTLSGGENGD